MVTTSLLSTILSFFFFSLKPHDYIHTITRQNTISKVDNDSSSEEHSKTVGLTL